MTIESVCITGGTGTMGRELVRLYLLREATKKVIVLSRDESKQERMAKEFNDPRLQFILGDVRDEESLYSAFIGVDLLIHAAALKRVGGGEENPIEYIKTNIEGVDNVCKAALRCRVKKALLLSTDKAVCPVNLYGASKQIGEKLFLQANDLSWGETDFGVIRYGNILGSNGSVVEKWQTEENSYVVDAYRFWITKERAAKHILYVSDQFERGEIAICKTFSSDVKLLYRHVIGDKPTTYGSLSKGERRIEYLMSVHESGLVFEDGNLIWLLPDGEQAPSYALREEQFIQAHETADYDSYSNPRRLLEPKQFNEACADAVH
jgi:UDP-N-acetylglucosamine 4,6-dehydratase